MSINIVFVEPEIPPNTGNISRTCAATGTKLHLVKPLGFSIDDKALKRAGLDYWQYLDLEVHESLDDFMAKYGNERLWLATTKAKHMYADVEYKNGDFILFGRETKGLPQEFVDAHPDNGIRIPMSENTRARSFNLSNSANIILFEALRQLGFPGLK